VTCLHSLEYSSATFPTSLSLGMLRDVSRRFYTLYTFLPPPLCIPILPYIPIYLPLPHYSLPYTNLLVPMLRDLPDVLVFSLSLTTPPPRPPYIPPNTTPFATPPYIFSRLPYTFAISPYTIPLDLSIPMLDHSLLVHFSTTSLSLVVPFDPSPSLCHRLVIRSFDIIWFIPSCFLRSQSLLD
jgi:hypothetical protein